MPASHKLSEADVAAIAPRLLWAGSGRVDRCPRCNAKIPFNDQEPCFSHCRMCGTLTPVTGTVIEKQIAFERSSGLSPHLTTEYGDRPIHYARRNGKPNGNKRPPR